MATTIESTPADLYGQEDINGLRREATHARAKHAAALEAGGYVSGLGDEVLPSDPREVTHEAIAVVCEAAAVLVERALRTGKRLSTEEAKFFALAQGYVPK